MTDTPNSIRDILDDILHDFGVAEAIGRTQLYDKLKRGVINSDEFYERLVEDHRNHKDQAEQTLNAYILGEVMELIGADEPTPASIFDYEDDDQRKWWYNRLRQELRNKANKKLGELPSLYGVKAVIHEHAPDDTMTIQPNPHKEQDE